MNGTCALIKGPQRASLPLPAGEDTVRRWRSAAPTGARTPSPQTLRNEPLLVMSPPICGAPWQPPAGQRRTRPTRPPQPLHPAGLTLAVDRGVGVGLGGWRPQTEARVSFLGSREAVLCLASSSFERNGRDPSPGVRLGEPGARTSLAVQGLVVPGSLGLFPGLQTENNSRVTRRA